MSDRAKPVSNASRDSSARPESPATASSAAERALDDERERELLRELDARCVSLARISGHNLGVAEQATKDAQRELTRRRTELAAIADSASTAARADARDRYLVLRADLAQLDDSASHSLEGCSAVRIGELSLSLDGTAVGSAPLFAPLLNRGNVVVASTDAHSATAANDVLLNIAARTFSTVRPGDVVCHWIDPRLRGALASLAPLRSSTVRLLEDAITGERDIDSCLEVLTAAVVRVTQLLGGRYRTLGELEAAAGESGEPYRLLVVSDFPGGFDEKSMQGLLRLMERGPSCGLSVVLHWDRSISPPRDVVPSAVMANAHVLEQTSTGWSVRSLPHLEATFDRPEPASRLSSMASAIADQAKTASAPSVPLSQVIAHVKATVDAPASERLTVGVGKAGVSMVTFTLGDGLDQTNNLLIGGAVGQGKSNALLTIIHCLAATYTPQDLEFFLLDFKEGLEFQQLAPGPQRRGFLPHATVLGLESDRLYGLSVLRHVYSEFDRRSEEFKGVGAASLTTYNQRRPDDRLARWLVILDEFQVLLEGGDNIAEEAIGLLETLARKGRAYGIHLVLASQTLSGITGLITKEDSIFSQFALRLALKTTARESQVLLSQNNTDASQLRYRGEAVFNREIGAVQGNQRITVAHAEHTYCEDLRASIAAEWPKRRPKVFVGGRPADPRELLHDTWRSSRSWSSVVARAVSVEQEPLTVSLTHEPGRHLAVIGLGSATEPKAPLVVGHEAIAILQSTCVSIALSAGSTSSRFIMLNALSADQAAVAKLPRLAMVLQAHGHDVDIVDVVDIGAKLGELATELSDASQARSAKPTYVIGWGMHRTVGLDRPDPISLDRPIEFLHAIIKDGPLFSMHFVGWWSSFQAYAQHVESNYAIAGLLQAFVFSRADVKDVAEVVGPYVSWPPHANRVFVYDRAGGGAVRVGVSPHTLDDADYDAIADWAQ